MDRGYREKAQAHFSESFELSKKHGDKRGLAEDHRNLGNLYFNNGKRKEAETSYLEALRLTQEVGDKVGAGQDYTYLGNLQFKDGKFDKAEEYFELGIECFKDVNSLP